MRREIKKVLRDKQRFLLTTHVSPDGDGIGAAAAMIELLLSMGKQVRFVCDSPIPEQFRFLDPHGLHEQYEEGRDYTDTEVLILLDAHRRRRVGRVGDLADLPGVVVICIDHHLPKETFGHYVEIDEEACCTGSMVYTLCKECGFDLNFYAAQGIYAGIICDTGRFCYSSTGRKAHKIADECIKRGVDPDEMFAKLFKHITLEEVKLFSHALSNREIYEEGKVLVLQIRQQDCPGIDLENADLDFIHDFNYQIADVAAFVLFRELPVKEVRISMRSRGPVDSADIMRCIGGGGHKYAAGAIYSGELEEIKTLILEKISDSL